MEIVILVEGNEELSKLVLTKLIGMGYRPYGHTLERETVEWAIFFRTTTKYIVCMSKDLFFRKPIERTIQAHEFLCPGNIFEEL